MNAVFLDIDLDFFLDRIAHMVHGDERLPSRDYRPWKEEAVREFLEGKCGLSRGERVPGRMVREHHEVWAYWTELRKQGRLGFPFELVHVDAHADLGLGGPSWKHILTEVVHAPPEDREAMSIPSLNQGNFLAYAIACRWLSGLTYVHHEKGGSDVHPYFREDFGLGANSLQMRALDATEIAFRQHEVERCTPKALEPPVPFRSVPGSRWRAGTRFAFAALAMSPAYTPNTADALLPVFRDYIDFGPDA